MSGRSDYIPRGFAEFDNWLRNLCQYLTKMCTGQNPQWTHIPQTVVDDLNNAYSSWYNAYAKTLVPHISSETKAKNEEMRKAMRTVRPIVQQYLKGSLITDAQRVDMNVPVRKTGRSNIGTPGNAPDFTIGIKEARILLVDYWDPGKDSKARPYGYSGAVIFYGVLDHFPLDVKELTGTKLATKRPYPITFTEADRGKRVYMAICWQNNKGQIGPISGIQMAIVP